MGALTSKPYAYKSRSWELDEIEGLDLFDSLGSNIRINIRNSEIIRILPRYEKIINDLWISDRIRFCIDGLRVQRLGFPLIKKREYFQNKEPKHIEISWLAALKYVKQNLIFNRQKQLLDVFLGDFKDIKFVSILKKMLPQLGATQFLGHEIDNNYSDFLSDWLINENNKDNACYILIGNNLRYEMPIYIFKVT